MWALAALFLFFQPSGDFFHERVGGHVDDWNDHFFSCFDYCLVFWQECVACECPIYSLVFDQFFRHGFGGCGDGKV